jgi:hypothetical protein
VQGIVAHLGHVRGQPQPARRPFPDRRHRQRGAREGRGGDSGRRAVGASASPAAPGLRQTALLSPTPVVAPCAAAPLSQMAGCRRSDDEPTLRPAGRRAIAVSVEPPPSRGGRKHKREQGPASPADSGFDPRQGYCAPKRP